VGHAFEVLATDPAVKEAGVDTGFRLSDLTMRAPDIAIGNVPAVPGWVKGAPPLAVEVAGVGQDEEELDLKIRQLFLAGTRWVWVVRIAKQHVEVHEAGRGARIAELEETLEAPGALANPVPVRALFDTEAAHAVALRNLLQRQGFESLDAVRAVGREEAHRQLVQRMRERGLSLEEISRATGLALEELRK
jgi:hypothetical protein